MALQKVFLLPPLKGLNLYDNPFTMAQDFAVELVNYMPPTTTFTVRPGIKRICGIEGQVRGIYSYTTGLVEDYGAHWYLSTIEYGAASLLLVKSIDTKGQINFFSLDPVTLKIENLGTISSAMYNDECAMYKHSLFFTSGQSGTAMNLYAQGKGLADFSLRIGEEGQTEISDMTNICIFKKNLFMSGNNSLNVYYIPATKADVYSNQSAWKMFENLFSPQFGASFSIDEVSQNGGSIIKLTTISRAGSDTVSCYLAIITDQGEIVLFDGEDPSDDTKWSVIGRFQIPPPLNKFAFTEMDGDYIVATKNGLISLRHIIFGQQSQLTEALEYRLMSLFSEYMFRMPSMVDFIGLYYHPRNRLLIFNVPTDMPMPFNKIIPSYNFDSNKSLVFPKNEHVSGTPAVTTYGPSQNTVDRILSFIKTYILKNCVNYSLIIEIDGTATSSNITVSFNATQDDPTKNPYQWTITVNFSVTLPNLKPDKEKPNLHTISFFKSPMTFVINDIRKSNTDITMTSAYPEWNILLQKLGPKSDIIYSFVFPDKDDNDSPYIITNIYPEISIFYNRINFITLETIENKTDIASYQNINIQESLYNFRYNNIPQSILDLVKDEDYMPSRFNNYEIIPTYYFGDFKDMVSLAKIYGKAILDTYSQILSCAYEPPLQGFIFTIDGTLVSSTGIKYFLRINFNGEALQYDSKTPSFFNFTLTDSMRFLDNDKNIISSYDIIIKGNQTTTGTISSRSVNFFNIPFAEKIIDTSLIFNWDFILTLQSQTNQLSGIIQNGMAIYLNQILKTWPLDIGWRFGNMLLNDITPTLRKKGVSDTTSSSITNIDLSAIPIFDGIDICCDFRSTQYVFDSHFGTWSSFKDVNMIKGIEHANDFYFIVPDDITYTDAGYVTAHSSLYKFEQNQLGDQHPDESLHPIQVSYKTVPTFDLGVPNKKIFKQITVFGNPSLLWQHKGSDGKYPFLVLPFSDFKEGILTAFIHSDDSPALHEKILNKHFKGKQLHELDVSEQRKFWQLYAEANDMISKARIPIRANPGSRFGLEIQIAVSSAYCNIYGFEIYFEQCQGIQL
jgi:hypothetical protein